MAHNIRYDSTKKVHNFFTVKEKAWHGLGEVLENCPTSEQAIKLAGLDFEVAKAPIFASLVNIEVDQAKNENEVIKSVYHQKGQTVAETRYFKAAKIKNAMATYRTDTLQHFGVVSDIYEVVQNNRAFEFFDAIVGDKQAIYETAGALGNGEVIFITAKLPDYIRVRNEDIEKYLLFTMGHDGKTGIQALFTPIRVVCNNTLTAALQGARNRVTIRHTKSAHERLNSAHNLLGIANSLSEELGEIFNRMALKEISDEQLVSYIEKQVLPSFVYEEKDEVKKKEMITSRAQNLINDIVKYSSLGPGQADTTCKNTVFGAYNAVTGYYQNQKKYTSLDYKFSSTFMPGDIDRKRQRAFDSGLLLLK